MVDWSQAGRVALTGVISVFLVLIIFNLVVSLGGLLSAELNSHVGRKLRQPVKRGKCF